jgi:twitching motility protein PilT
MSEKTPLLRELLLLCIQEKASDLHLTEKTPPIFRIDGRLIPMVNAKALSRDEIQ